LGYILCKCRDAFHHSAVGPRKSRQEQSYGEYFYSCPERKCGFFIWKRGFDKWLKDETAPEPCTPPRRSPFNSSNSSRSMPGGYSRQLPTPQSGTRGPRVSSRSPIYDSDEELDRSAFPSVVGNDDDNTDPFLAEGGSPTRVHSFARLQSRSTTTISVSRAEEARTQVNDQPRSEVNDEMEELARGMNDLSFLYKEEVEKNENLSRENEELVREVRKLKEKLAEHQKRLLRSVAARH